MTPYFAYGSNMSTPRLVQRVGEVRVLGPARLEGYEHRFSKRGNDGSAKGNVDEQGSLAGQYGVRSIPTLLFFRDGKVAEQMVGAAPKGALAAKLDAMLAVPS